MMRRGRPDYEALAKRERALLRTTPVNERENFDLFDQFMNHARQLGHDPAQIDRRRLAEKSRFVQALNDPRLARGDRSHT